MELATLAKIDPDVRLQIYQEMFRDVIITANITKDDAFPEDEPTLKFTHKPQHSLSILRTCRAVYNEAIPELWSTARVTGRTIMLDTDDEYGDMNYAKLNDLTRCIPPTIQVQIRHLRSVVLSPASQNLNKTNNKNNDDNLAAFPALRTLEIRQLGSGSKAVGDPLPTTTLSGVPVALCDGDGNSSRPRTDLTLTQKVPLHKTVYRFATLTTAQRNLAPLDYLALSYKLGDIWTRNPRLQVFSKGVLGHVEHGRNLTEAGSATCHLVCVCMFALFFNECCFLRLIVTFFVV